MQSTPWDIIWITCIVLCNVLFFVRKAILADHGYPFSLIDLELKDGPHLRQVIASTPEGRKKMWLQILNRGVGTSFALGVIVLLAVRALPALLNKW